MASVDTDNVFKGALNQGISEIKSKSLKIVLLSTREDFNEERSLVWFEVLPELQQYCLQHGAEVTLIDPHQGTNELTANNQFDFSVVFDEFQQAKQRNFNGFFVLCLVGDIYGAPPLPASIKQDEFKHIRTSAFEQGKDVKLMDSFYKLDQNCVPPVYQFVKNNSRNKPMTRTEYSKLLDVLQGGAASAYQEGLINQVSKQQQDRFFTSANEQLIKMMLAERGALNHCFFVLRKHQDNHVARNGEDSAFFDSIGSNMDVNEASTGDVEKKLSNFKNDLAAVLEKPNYETFLIVDKLSDSSASLIKPARAGKSALHTLTRSKYKERFAQLVTYKIKQLFDRILVNPVAGQIEEWRNKTYVEAKSHLEYCSKHKCANLVGLDVLQDTLRKTASSQFKKKNSVIIIKGSDGSGKTALLCEIAHKLQSWLGHEVILITRFVGLSPGTVMTHELIANICLQLITAYGLKTKPMPTYERSSAIEIQSEWLQNCLEDVSKSAKAPLALLIDNLHQLKSGHQTGGKKFDWLPSTVPENVIIICTTSERTSDGAIPIRRVDPKCCFTIPILGETTLFNITKNVLSRSQRTISADQITVVQQCLVKTPTPLFANLIAHHVMTWPSWMVPKKTGFQQMTMDEFVMAILLNTEEVYDRAIMESVCCFFECAEYGISECELLDALSCNKESMEVLVPIDSESPEPYRTKRLRGGELYRFFPQPWLNIKKILHCLLEEVNIDGIQLLRWKSVHFSPPFCQRYLNTSSQRKRYHLQLADIFLNTWFEAEASQSLNESEGEQRILMPRPLKFNTGEVCIYNIRRIRELWFHLIYSGNIDMLESKALFNFEYIYSVLEATTLEHLIAVMEGAMYQVLHHDLQVLYNSVIRPALVSLNHSKLLLAGEIIGRLRASKGVNSKYVNQLVEQAMVWVDSFAASPLLVPLTCWFPSPKYPLALGFQLMDFSPGMSVIQPTRNYQHLLVTGQKLNYEVRMYHLASKTLVKTFEGHSDLVTCIKLSSDGQFFITGSADKSIRTWDLLLGNCIRNVTPHVDKINCLELNSDDSVLISGSQDCTVKFIDLSNGQIIRTIATHQGPIFAMCLSDGDEMLITGSADFYVRIFSTEDGSLISQIGGLMAPVISMCLTSNDAFLMVACDDETVKVFSLCSTTEIHDLRVHEGKAASLAIANDDCQLFVGSHDGKVYTYDLHTAEILDIKDCHNLPVRSVKVSKDGHFLMSISGDWCHVWNVDRRKHCEQNLKLPNNEIYTSRDKGYMTTVKMSADCQNAIAGYSNGQVDFWSLEACHILWRTIHDPLQKQQVTVVNISLDGEYSLAGTSLGYVSIWASNNGQLLRQFMAHKTPIRTLEMLADAQRVMSQDDNDTVLIWPWQQDPSTIPMDEVISLKGIKGNCLLSKSEKDLIGRTLDSEKEVRIWTLSDESVINLRAKLSHVDAITCIVLSRDSKLLLTGSKDQSLKVWEQGTGFLTQILVGHDGDITCCAATNDNRKVVSGSEDCTIFYWKIQTGETLQTFKKHTKTVTGVAVTSDSTVCISVSLDGWLYAWELARGICIAAFNVHMPIQQIQCTPDASRIVLKCERGSELPILCLHNSPAVLGHHDHNDHLHPRGTSFSSQESGNISINSNSSHHAQTNEHHVTAAPIAPVAEVKRKHRLFDRQGSKSKVFAQLESSRSRPSLAEAATNVTVVVSSSTSGGKKPEVASSTCLIL